MPDTYRSYRKYPNLEAYKIPTVVMWNRLEGSPRTADFKKALKAEVRDALWMLTKQWQLGEFKADDAGSPVSSKVHISKSKLNSYEAAKQGNQAFDNDIPLEARVEQKQIQFLQRNTINRIEGDAISIDIRLQMGNYWLKLIKSMSLNYRTKYIEQNTFKLPNKSRDTAFFHANKDVLQQLMAIKDRCMDGYEFYKKIKNDDDSAALNITTINDDANDIPKLNNLGKVFKKWYKNNYLQPEEDKNNAWLSNKLEYQFECSSKTNSETKILDADEYYNGHLDWYAFNLRHTNETNADGKDTYTDSFIPTHVEFDGMPDTRWWKFEDSKTSFGDINPNTGELSKLLLIEFGLIFANDWFVIPFKMPIGSLANVEGLTVTNNFGETIWIDSSEKDNTTDTKWSIFKQQSDKFDNSLFLAPSAIKVHESKPLEEILFIRDEMSNMVWGIETTVPLPTGIGAKGSEQSLQIRQFHEKYVSLINHTISEASFYLNYLNNKTDLPPILSGKKSIVENIISTLNINNVNTDIKELINQLNEIKVTFARESIEYVESKNENDFKAKINYLAMTDVPENWIPFIPVHKKGDSREIQLQRASMPRIVKGEIDSNLPTKIKPQTSILREGLEIQPNPEPYYIHEEEITRSGIRVQQTFQRTRWINGEVFVWLGMKKKTGKGEGSSGLSFDQIKDV